MAVRGGGLVGAEELYPVAWDWAVGSTVVWFGGTEALGRLW